MRQSCFRCLCLPGRDQVTRHAATVPTAFRYFDDAIGGYDSAMRGTSGGHATEHATEQAVQRRSRCRGTSATGPTLRSAPAWVTSWHSATSGITACTDSRTVRAHAPQRRGHTEELQRLVTCLQAADLIMPRSSSQLWARAQRNSVPTGLMHRGHALAGNCDFIEAVPVGQTDSGIVVDVSLDAAGTRWYACNVADHCAAGALRAANLPCCGAGVPAWLG